MDEMLIIIILQVLSTSLPTTLAVLAGDVKNYDKNSKLDTLEQWEMAGIGELCEKRALILEKVNKRPNDTEFRREMALSTCDEHLGLSCNFEIPDLKEVVMVCDCSGTDRTWDADKKECRLFAGRKQFCTNDAQCITGATCKNEASKLRDYYRWEAAVYKKYNLTKPRAALSTVNGKIQEVSIDDARRLRKRILSRVVRHSYKEEVGECTCTRSELNLEFINKTDPCPARKHPPPLRFAIASQICPLGFSILAFLVTLHIIISWDFAGNKI